MKVIQVMLGILMLDALIVYLYRNVFTVVNTGVADGWLAVAIALGLLAVFWKAVRSRCVSVEASTALLLAFILYFLVKSTMDLNGVDLKQYTIGTTSGVLFGLFLGILSSIVVQGLLSVSSSSIRARKLVSYGLLSFIVVYGGTLVVGYFREIGHLSVSTLAIMHVFGYQRAGNYLSLMFLLVSLTVAGVVYINKRSDGLRNKLPVLISIIIYVISVPLLMLEAQLRSSNSALLFVAVIFVVTAAFLWIGLRRGKKGARRAFLWRIIRTGVMTIVLLGLISWGAVSFLNVNVGNLRVMNYGEGGMVPTSVATRLTLLRRDYLTQLDYEPFFGNMAVDTITTGTGTYAHSLPLSLLSHLGIVGFFLFSVFLGLRMRELARSASWCGTQIAFGGRQDNFQKFVFYVLLAVVLIASVTTFFVWLPLWFALGLMTPPIVFHSRWSEARLVRYESTRGLRRDGVLP